MHMEELQPGEFFVQRFSGTNGAIYMYGYLHGIDENGDYHSQYQSRFQSSEPLTFDREDHELLGTLSESAYRVAAMRNWPDDAREVEELIAYSSGGTLSLSLIERVRLFLKW